jgi:hypothetical protein
MHVRREPVAYDVSIRVAGDGSVTLEVREDADVEKLPAQSLGHAQEMRAFLESDVYEGILAKIQRL